MTYDIMRDDMYEFLWVDDGKVPHPHPDDTDDEFLPAGWYYTMASDDEMRGPFGSMSSATTHAQECFD